ncbi:hypothetical protein ZIOFF_016216 [Zingiber officinale]|uniref:ornithine aminotransferase n=1 Tax=Zingiber officinale TaxID=94328 RepID=A0A8J5HVN4_ZINOF|nr:hypothetical protein ZIOFF_016216 [Zingiber officinale]
MRVLAPGALEGELHLVESANAQVPGVRCSDVQIQGEEAAEKMYFEDLVFAEKRECNERRQDRKLLIAQVASCDDGDDNETHGCFQKATAGGGEQDRGRKNHVGCSSQVPSSFLVGGANAVGTGAQRSQIWRDPVAIHLRFFLFDVPVASFSCSQLCVGYLSNYHPIPMVFSKASGTCVWDPEGNKYIDFLSAYSAVNQGHCHPKVMKALIEQAQKLTLSSRAFYNDKFPTFAEHVTQLFGYDMMLPMNTGAEGVETALKLARKWGYKKKKIPQDKSFGILEFEDLCLFSAHLFGSLDFSDCLCFTLGHLLGPLALLRSKALIVSCCGCFHGRTVGVISMSCDNDATRDFGPLVPGHLKVKFGNVDALEKIFKDHGEQICGFLFEPIQGEAGVIIPPDGYLRSVRDLCSRYNILMIADEIQTGIARTGRMLACDWEMIRPDVVILGKALGAGVIPVSVVLADKEIMLCIQPGEHGSTFGGNPLASAVAVAALDVIKEEELVKRAEQLGQVLRDQLGKVQLQFPQIIKEVRGKGLLNAIDLNHKALSPVSAYDICMKLKERGILAKPTHDTIIRLAPPLTISLEEISEASKAISDVLEIDLPKMQKQKQNAETPTPTQACDRCGKQLHDSTD